jgi:deazaflavin-dependent oxidoreductase (nitroreductase family)
VTPGQEAEPYREPPRDKIPAISRSHVAAMEASDDDAVWVLAGMHHVVLRTVGRRSGNEHKVALPFWRDEQGERIVVASFAGAETHPSWYLNLSDRTANPDVHVRVQGGEYRCTPEILDGDEYDARWAQLCEDRPNYADYQTRTERRIPLVRLPDPRPGGATAPA